MKKLLIFLAPVLFLAACSDGLSCKDYEEIAYHSGFAAGRSLPSSIYGTFDGWLTTKSEDYETDFRNKGCEDGMRLQFEVGWAEGFKERYYEEKQF